MPLYEYQCDKCKKTFEVLQKINSDPLTSCIHCKGHVRKLVSVSSFRLKGNGWYLTDYKKRNSSPSTTNKKDKDIKNIDSNKKAGDSKNAAIK
jgi:putative FmdB family regulatory protein